MNILGDIFFGMIAISIIAIFFIGGVYFLYRSNKEEQYTNKTYGKIINNIRHKTTVYDTRSEHYVTKFYWHSLCEYTVGNTKCVRETNRGTAIPKYKIGQTVAIYYNPQNCHEAYIEGDNNSKAKAIVCFILGIFLSVFLYFAKKIIG